IDIEYAVDLFSLETIERCKGHFLELVKSIIHHPHQAISQLPMIQAAERAELLEVLDRSQVGYPKAQNIVQLFSQQVAQSPSAIAIQLEEEKLTYRELENRSNQLAHYLKAKGVRSNTLVALCMDRSLEMIIAIFGILKAGGAYVPIDPNYPQDRIDYILAETQTEILLTDQITPPKEEHQLALIQLPSVSNEIASLSTSALKETISPDQAAYVIYTSGSTGRPKGVLVEHSQVVRLLFNDEPLFDFGPEDCWTFFHSYCFDFSVWELFGPLLSGGRALLLPIEISKDQALLAKHLAAEKVTVLNQTPGAFYVLQEYLSHQQEPLALRYVIFGGDALDPSRLQAFHQQYPNCKLINMYGITETTVHVTYKALNEEDLGQSTSNIGRPIPTMSCYILDQHGQLLPKGIPGELYVGGAGLSRGYLNQAGLNHSRFVPVSWPTADGQKLYRTGDWVRCLNNGDLAFLGRIDEQVQIRGFRIELGEIDRVLNQCPALKAGAVIAKEDEQGIKRLVGYVVGNDDDLPKVVQGFLREQLPAYMIPEQWMVLDALPLSSNGKIDKKALPAPDQTSWINMTYVAPRTALEKQLSIIWSDLLALKKIGVHDNFFALGGHSLLAMRVVAAIRKSLAIELPVSLLFQYPTIAELADALTTTNTANTRPEILAGPRPAQLPLSFAQERIWFLEQLAPGTNFHIPLVLQLEGEVNIKALEQAFQQLVERQEVLRTVFYELDGVPYQRVLPSTEWSWQLLTKQVPHSKEAIATWLNKQLDQVFDLSRDCPFRVSLLKHSSTQFTLLILLHHIATDAWSSSLLVDELTQLYQAYAKDSSPQIAPLPLQYVDYAIWQRTEVAEDTLAKKLNWWKDQLQGMQAFELSTDFARPKKANPAAARLSIELPSALSQELKRLAKTQEASLFMTLLAAFNILLYRRSGQADISLGTTVANRPDPSLETLIGFFVNTLVIRSEVEGSANFETYLQQVKEKVLAAFAHQEVPFERVVEAIDPKRDRSRPPLFQVLFELQNTPDHSTVQLDHLSLKTLEDWMPTTRFDLRIVITTAANQIHMDWIYRKDLFLPSSVENLKEQFLLLLNGIVQMPRREITKYPLIHATTQKQLLDQGQGPIQASILEETLLSSFTHTVATHSNAIALVEGDQKMSYAELDARSTSLAQQLLSKGYGPDTIIGLSFDPGMDLIISLLGVLKSGGAYVPIDPGHPESRVAYMLSDSSAALVLCHSSTLDKYEALSSLEVWSVDKLDLAAVEDSPSLPKVQPTDLAYILYTSGSTGQPKGVRILHQSLNNYLQWSASTYALPTELKMGVYSSIGFDMSVTALYLPLLVGGQQYLYGRGEPHERLGA
ncbi:MAG: amino acid adenylation domain-containing protein, partial [Bacteroidota bacterium]